LGLGPDRGEPRGVVDWPGRTDSRAAKRVMVPDSIGQMTAVSPLQTVEPSRCKRHSITEIDT
jgi:hypothetical protein